MKFLAVLFDMNGVIVNDEPLHLSAFQKVFRDRRHELTTQEYEEKFAGRTDEAGFEAYLGEKELDFGIDELMRDKAQAYYELAAGNLRAYPGVPELIGQLHDRGVRLGLVTGAVRSEAQAVLAAFEIADMFEVVVSAEDVRRGKPSPEGYLAAAKHLGIAPEKCVVIEDSPSGVAAGKAAGMTCVGFTSTHAPEQLAAADLLIDRLEPGCLDFLG